MKVYSEVCPVCGTVNEHLYLEETEGYYECQCCKGIFKSTAYDIKLSDIPVFDLEKSEDQLRLLDYCGIKQKSNGVA